MKKGRASQSRLAPNTRIGELLADLFDRYQGTFDSHQWPWEPMRWYELVRCLFSVVEGHFGRETRAASAVRVLTELGLLEIPVLAQADETTRHQLGIVLGRLGFSPDQISRLVRALHDLAKCLDEAYQGRIQLLLRSHATQLASDVLRVLPLEESLGDEAASLVVTHWLQNVLNLPVLVPSPGLQALLAETGAGVDEVLAAVDEQNINTALLDEILNLWAGAYPAPKEASGQQEAP